jgi:hypothetical protein
MDNTRLRESLIAQADVAFIKLAEQVDDLLDAAQFYCDLYPAITKSDRIKSDGLNLAISEMAQLLRQISLEIERWKREDDRILSRLGVETQYLNELKATMEATMLFFIRQDIPLKNFTLGVVNQAHTELVRCNRLL